STSNVRLIADLLLMRGNIGKPGAGICPLRGHSNVQGNRTVGISEKPSAAFLDSLQRVMGISTSNVRLIADLLLMRGNIGKPGAGICPLRGHSN
uniref:hypothetical protein n=1 Tax=Escherichia coli TaxID=562 RepID=UPI001125AC07